jgi:hypothetical protein
MGDFPMRNPTATLCLTVAVLLGSAGVSWNSVEFNVTINLEEE